jgi:hypothetical protein
MLSQRLGDSCRHNTVVGALAAGVAAFLCAPAASAHGRFPLSNQIVFSPSDPNLIVARTTYGILPSRDNGTTWGFVCEEALGLPAVGFYPDPRIGLTQTNALVAGVYSPLVGVYADITAGLDVSVDLGCNWSCIEGPLAKQAVIDVVVRPDRPDVVLALTSTNRSSADAGDAAVASMYASQVFQSTDDGAQWAQLTADLDPTVLVQTIDVARSDPHRIYVSGTRGFGSFRSASLFVWTEDGAGWQEHSFAAFDPLQEDSLYIGAVDPDDPNRVYVRTGAIPDGPGLSRLFVTTDGGQSFELAKAFTVPLTPNGIITNMSEILGFALSPDGSKVYAGSKEEGLFVANRADLAFHQTSTIAVQCLATRGSELWACSDAKSGFIVGASIDDGATFASKMKTVLSVGGAIACSPNPGGPFACGANANASLCQQSFEMFCQTYSVTGRCEPDLVDGGAASAMDAGVAHGSSSGCGCSTPGGGIARGAGGLAGAVLLVLRRRQGSKERCSPCAAAGSP